jgi:hypothetical protein
VEQTTKDLMLKVHSQGFNIYKLVGYFAKKMSYLMPESAIITTCEAYLKQKPKIKNEWTFMVRVLKAKRDEVNAKAEIKRGEEFKKQKVAPCLKDIMRSI